MGVTVTSCGWSPRLLTDLLGALFRNGYVCTICVHRCAREGARLPSALLKQKHALPRPAESQATGLFPMLTCLRRNYRAVDLKLKKGELSRGGFAYGVLVTMSLTFCSCRSDPICLFRVKAAAWFEESEEVRNGDTEDFLPEC